MKKPDLFIKDEDLVKFKEWLEDQGCEILPPTNEYEVIRFKGLETGVLYASGKASGIYFWKAYSAYKHNKPWIDKPPSTKRKKSYLKEKKYLLKRDGHGCFYCGLPLGDDMTVEHLISLTQQGPNKLFNMVLAHEECNQKAKNKSLKDKVALAVKLRYERLKNK
jgi:hypothetical protein